MKPPLTNISVSKLPRPLTAVMPADGDSDTANGNGQSVTQTTLNVIGAITYAGSSSVTVVGDVEVVGMVESLFLTKFREKFMGTGAPGEQKPWPRPSVNTPLEFTTEFTDVFRSLFLLLEAGTTPAGGVPGSAKQMILELITDTHWPADTADAPVPEPWNSNGQFNAFRRYEIASAMHLLMRTFNGLGAGGGSTPFPPDH